MAFSAPEPTERANYSVVVMLKQSYLGDTGAAAMEFARLGTSASKDEAAMDAQMIAMADALAALDCVEMVNVSKLTAGANAAYFPAS